MKVLTAIFFVSLCAFSFGQENQLALEPVLGKEPISLEQPVNWGENGEMTFTEFKFYLSNIHIDKEQQAEDVHADSVVLFDLSADSIPHFRVPSVTANTNLSMTLGNDSVLSTMGAMGGKLDPMYGMYWSWQSGYIHVKLSGRWKKDGRTQEFTYHLGGYHSYNVNLSLTPTATRLRVDCQSILEALLLQQANFHIMSPGKIGNDALELFTKGMQIF